MIHLVKSFEYHVGGQPVRVIVDGVPAPQGKSQAQKAAWFERHADHYRRAIVLEPRGHEDMTAVLLTEPASPGAHAGLLFLDAAGYPRLAGHGVLAAATAAVERGLVFARDAEVAGGRLVFDTPAGQVKARAPGRRADGATGAVVYASVPAFVLSPGRRVPLTRRTVTADVAFGGEFYAIADGESSGVPLDGRHLPELRRLGHDICAELNKTPVTHPGDASVQRVAGVVFTGPARSPAAHLRSVVVSAGGSVDRSPGGGATTAVMAVLDAMGLFADGEAFVLESLNDSLLTGRLEARTAVGEAGAIVVEIEGQAWATGEQTWCLDHDDPFHHGFSLGARPDQAPVR